MWVVRAALKSSLDRVAVVLGSRWRELEAALKEVAHDRRLIRIINPQPESGMSSSLRAGISEVRAEAAGAMILLADQPGVTAWVVDELLRAFRGHPERIVVPTIEGRRTTPVIFPSDLFPQLKETRGDVGGREVLNLYHDRVVEMEMGSRYDDMDVDTREDLEKMMLKMRSKKGKPR